MSNQTMYFRQVVLKKLPTKVTHHGITFIGDVAVSGNWYNACFADGSKTFHRGDVTVIGFP